MSRTIDKPLDSASKRHKELYELFCNSNLFKNMTIKQEVPVHDLAPNYYNRRHKVDWFIKELNIVIELHGRQHRKATRWGNISSTQAHLNLFESKKRDRQKEQALRNAGYTYICVWYDEKLTEDFLIKKIKEATMHG